jgi:hypothetical protein
VRSDPCYDLHVDPMNNIAASASHHGFDASLYPRTYTVSRGNRLIWISLGALLGIGGFFGVWYFATGHEAPSSGAAILMSLICLSFALLGSYLAVSMVMFKVILRADAIEVQNVGSKRTLLREEIVGRRLLPTQYISTLELTPRDKGNKKLKIGMTMRTDAAFDAWLASITDLDAAELAKSETQIASELEFGLTPEQRAETLGNARTTAKWLTRIAWVVSIGGWFYPRPYQLIMAILAALPLITVMLVVQSKGLYQVEGRRNDARPSLTIPFLFPGLILALRAITGIQFLHWMPFLTLCLLGGCVFTLLIASADRQTREHRWGMLTIFLLAAAYTFGVSAQADELLDRSPRQTFQVAVLSKRMVSGRSTTYYLRVTPWGPQSDANDVSVSRALYNSVAPKQTVCVNFLQGALKIPWYFVTACH